jgi:hypothetical protein
VITQYPESLPTTPPAPACPSFTPNSAQRFTPNNSQNNRMGVFEMGWLSKATMQELDGVQAVLQLLHEPFIFVHAGPSLTFNTHLKYLPSNMREAAIPGHAETPDL